MKRRNNGKRKIMAQFLSNSKNNFIHYQKELKQGNNVGLIYKLEKFSEELKTKIKQERDYFPEICQNLLTIVCDCGVLIAETEESLVLKA